MIKLTEEILQSCFKQKTIFRNAEWDIIWYLGGKNDVKIGEKDGKYYLIPKTDSKPVVELLPEGLVQARTSATDEIHIPIETVKDLEKVYPELAFFT